MQEELIAGIIAVLVLVTAVLAPVSRRRQKCLRPDPCRAAKITVSWKMSENSPLKAICIPEKGEVSHHERAQAPKLRYFCRQTASKSLTHLWSLLRQGGAAFSAGLTRRKNCLRPARFFFPYLPPPKGPREETGEGAHPILVGHQDRQPLAVP